MRTCSARIKKTNHRSVMTGLSEQENVPRAAAWLVLGVAGGLGLDLCAKQILQTYPLVQFILLRSGIAMLIMLAVAPRFGGYEALRSKEIGWHFLRTLFAIGAMYGFFYGVDFPGRDNWLAPLDRCKRRFCGRTDDFAAW